MKKLSSYFKKKKKFSFFIIFIIIIASMLVAANLMMQYIRTDTVSKVETINKNGKTGEVFVAYRPGVSTFQTEITYAFILGLEENDWKIKVTTISSKTPTDLSSYDLIVIGTPTYSSEPHDSVKDYLKDVDDLDNKDVVIIVSAGGSDSALSDMEDRVKDAGGKVVMSIIVYTYDGFAKIKCYKSGQVFN
ncbi:MAG: flavodoxin family protein [Candidatus Hermodarchaeota archaeon]